MCICTHFLITGSDGDLPLQALYRKALSQPKPHPLNRIE